MRYLVGYVEECTLKIKAFKMKQEMDKFIKSFKSDGDNWIYFKITKVGGKFKWLN